MKFVKSIGGTTYAVDKITRIHPSVTDRGREVCSIDVEGLDAPAAIFARDVEKITTAPVQLLPAADGTAFIYAMEDPDDAPVTSTIIAWALCADGELRGVTPNGVDDGHVSNANYILMPDGKVRDYDSEYENVSAWLKDYYAMKAESGLTDAPAQ